MYFLYFPVVLFFNLIHNFKYIKNKACFVFDTDSLVFFFLI